MIMFPAVIIACLIVVVGTKAMTYPVLQNLGSNLWQVQNDNMSVKARATVPGGIYSDLRTAGILKEDIFYRFNDEDYRWVAKESWTYSVNFYALEDVYKKGKVYLIFEGLDTVAQIKLNGHNLADTDNMFVAYQFDVKNILKKSTNNLEVRFTSPVVAARTASKETPYLVPPECVPGEYHGECHVNYLRKMQASFAWDWGPAFPSVGIWKNVVLQGYNTVNAKYITVETRPETADWKVSVTLFLDVSTNCQGTLTATLVLNSTDKITSKRTVSVSPQQNAPSLVFAVLKEKVSLWWPNGYGSQTLYKLIVGFQCGEENTQRTVRIGFRTIQLIQDQVAPNEPKKGMTFYFRVNGVAIFAKGSNYIPLHILPELGADRMRLQRLLTSTRDANMNMLRVWGGGVYESDLFYEMCDELGIMVWQDMMFACSMYPATDKFLASVKLEVTQQVLRLQHHPSVAIWAGNNENEAALVGNWYGTSSNFSTFKQDYIKLYVDTIRPVILQLDKTRSYVTSSPSNGIETEKEGFVAENPYDGKFGDLHYYEYTLNLWNTAIMPKTRFASEYGIMSMPSIESFAKITLPEDLTLKSQFMNSRQHHFGGYAQMVEEINNNLHYPPETTLENFIYLSQINQAMSIKTETESYRRERNTLNSVGEGLTMGALYWQLNDVWQAPSWSSVELNGKWKMLHYYAVNFFSPILVSPSLTITRELKVHIISDLKLHTSLNLVLQLSVFNWNSFTPVLRLRYPFTLLGAGVQEVGSWNIDTLLNSVQQCNDQADKNCFFHFSLLATNGSTPLGPDNYYFPAKLHSINGPPKPNFQVVDIKPLKNMYEVIMTLSTNAISLFVWLDAEGINGHFSHNGFHMVTNNTQLTFISEEPIDVNLFRKSLKINTLQLQKYR